MLPTLYSLPRTGPSYPASSPWPWLNNYLGLVGPSSSAGIYIDETSAQNISTVYHCVTMIAQMLASLPIGCYRKSKENDREVADQHPSHWIFNKSPDDIMPSFNYREALQGHVLLRGNSYSEIVRNYRGQAISCHLLDPRKVQVYLEEDEHSQYPVYKYQQPTGKSIDFDRSQILHFTNWSTNGLVGIPPLTLFRESLGTTLAANRYVSEYFKKGGHPLGFLTKSTNIGKKDRDQLRDEWKEFHGSMEQSHQVGILSGGMDWKSIGLSNHDAQLLGLRQFQKFEISELFHYPLSLLNTDKDFEVEGALVQLLILCLLPWMKRHEGEMNMKCFTRMERFNYYLEYNADAVLRGSMKDRQEAFSIMAKHGAILLDEWRQMENKPPLPDGMGKIPFIMASQFAKLEDIISGKANLDTTNRTSKKSEKKDTDKVVTLAKHYSRLPEHDRTRLKGLILSMNGTGTFQL